jgi:hypothetical protein
VDRRDGGALRAWPAAEARRLVRQTTTPTVGQPPFLMPNFIIKL